MISQKIFRNNIRHILRYSLWSGLSSGLLVTVLTAAGIVRISSNIPLAALATGFAMGFLFGFLIPFLARSFLDLLLTHRRIRKITYLGRIGVIVLAVGASMALVHILAGLVFPRGNMLDWETLRISLSVTLVMFVLVFTSHTLTEFLGRGFFKDMVLGRYHRAREEEKIFLFVDLRGSTALAESLSPEAFYNLLNDFLSIVEQCCHYYGGRVYKYLGDGSITVWPARPGSYAQAVSAVRDIQAELAEQNPSLEKFYGQTLELTAGLHYGTVLVGELGTFRKEIGYWGDTVNTTQRIQAACKEHGVTNLCSEDFYKRLKESDGDAGTAITFENVALRGKEQPMKLVSF